MFHLMIHCLFRYKIQFMMIVFVVDDAIFLHCCCIFFNNTQTQKSKKNLNSQTFHIDASNNMMWYIKVLDFMGNQIQIYRITITSSLLSSLIDFRFIEIVHY